MFGLGVYADAFDAFHKEMQENFEQDLLVKFPQANANLFGPDSWITYGMALPVGEAYALTTFGGNFIAGFVDVLRLGEGVQKLTVRGFAEDGLRLLTLAPFAGTGAKLLTRGTQTLGAMARTQAVSWATRVAGQEGLNSCAPTAIAVAQRVSGRAVTMTLGEIGSIVGKVGEAGETLHPDAAAFPGMYVDEIEATLNHISPGSVERVASGNSIEAIEAAVSQGRGPVVFGVHWETPFEIEPPTLRDPVPNPDFFALDPEPSTLKIPAFEPVEPEPITVKNPTFGAETEVAQIRSHALVAFRDAEGAIKVADQYGVRPLAELGTIPGQPPALFDVASRAWVVRDGAVMRSVSSMQNASFSAPNWLDYRLGVSSVLMGPAALWAIDTGMRTMLGRPAREWPGMPPGTLAAVTGQPGTSPGPGPGPGPGPSPAPGPVTPVGPPGPVTPGPGTPGQWGPQIPAPNPPPSPNVLSSTLQSDELLVLSKIPTNGDSREFAQLQVECGLSSDRIRNALLGLMSGVIVVQTWATLNGQPTPALVSRALN